MKLAEGPRQRFCRTDDRSYYYRRYLETRTVRKCTVSRARATVFLLKVSASLKFAPSRWFVVDGDELLYIPAQPISIPPHGQIVEPTRDA